MNTEAELKFYYNRMSELYRLACIAALLNWDQRVTMPAQAAQARADQLEYIGVTSHQKATDPAFMDTVDELFETLDSLSLADQVNIRETKRILDKERKLPEDFIAELHQVSATAYSAWVAARPSDDFQAVKPYLEKLVELSRKECDLLGYEQHPYDALLDQYEPGARTAQIKPLLLELAEELRELIPPIADKFGSIPPLQGQFPVEKQQQLSRQVAEKLGFSFESGRIDPTAHPFMTSLGPSDFRITTRYDQSNFLSSLFSTIHETGHALYELGLPKEYAGTPMGSPVSLGIHESQSRMWENLVGRSREFISCLSEIALKVFPEESAVMKPESLWKYANRVQPSLIRTEADEVTYNQHIVIRMLVEEALIKNELQVEDLPDAWSNLYEKYLGVHPSDFRNGVMQDVHWYHGSIGYFPTYSLGNLYSAMMMESAQEALPDLPEQIQQGDFSSLLNWLRENIHQHGMRYKGSELIQNITGKELSAKAFIEYLKKKFM